MDAPLIIILMLVVGVVIFIASFKTYYIPIESFKKQFAEIDSDSLISVKTRGPAGGVSEYLANPIKEILCVDKRGRHAILRNSPSIEVRFTNMKNKRTIFYFDRIYVEDSIIYGDRSRFIHLSKNIHIDEIKKIEVQDGKKRFKYVD